MFSVGGRRNKKVESDPRKPASIPWQEKKELAEKEEEELRKDIGDLTTWVDMIETLNDQQLKGYVESHHGDSKMSNGQRMKNKVQGAGKSKTSTSGIMASVWKFHNK